MRAIAICASMPLIMSLSGCQQEETKTGEALVTERDLESLQTLTPSVDPLRPIHELETLTPMLPVQRPLEDLLTNRPTVDVLRPINDFETNTPTVDVLRPIDEFETLTPMLPVQRPLDDLLTNRPSVDALRPIHDLETNTPTVEVSFDIPNKYVIDSYPIEREYTYAYTLDNVTVSYAADADTYTISNETPRYIQNPTLLIDGLLYRLETYIEPFQRQTFQYRSHTNERAKSIEFIDEQPLFKSKINGFTDLNGNPEFRQATASEALRFEQEFRGHKSAANDYSLTAHIAEYIASYGVSARSAKFQSLTFDYADCPYDDHEHTHPMVRSGNDASTANTKLLSYLNHQPTAQHLITLNGGVNGVATVGNGWLALRSHRIYSEGRTEPFTTFMHEKHHNHGYGHSGGMTYGIPDVIINYRRNNNALLDYYDSEKLALEIPKAVVNTDFEFDGDYINTKFTFLSQREAKLDLVNTISRFMLVLPDGIDEESISVSIVENGAARALTPTDVYAHGKVLSFESDFELDIENFNAQLERASSYINVRMLSPSTSQTFTVLASGHEGDWAIQANKIVKIGADIGLNTGDGRFVYYANVKGFDETGVMVETLAEYTPEQAEQICVDKGFSGLGLLETYKSTAQMNFQMAYLPYKSQVGIDPDTLQPVAVAVESSYRPEHTNYVDAGSLVVCQ